MKKLLFCVCLASALAAAGYGQDQKKQPPPVDSGQAASDSSPGRSIRLNSGTSIEGQLQNSVDVKKAKVGDQVVLKTTKSIKQNGETVVPKGSKLVGHVTEVQQKTKSNGASKLGLVFDRLENKEMSTPITASIVSVTNVASSTRVADSASSDLFGSTSTSTQAAGGSTGGGGLLGGVSGTAGGVLNTTSRTLGGVTNSAGQTLGTTAGLVGHTVSGIQISNAVNGSVQSGSTLSAANKNIRLEKGVTFQLTLNSSVQQ